MVRLCTRLPRPTLGFEMSEYITLVNCTAKLVIALRSDTSILHYLDREGFIKPNIYEDVNNPKSMLSASEKAGLLVSGIKDKVELNPKNYHKLMRHFHQDRRLYGDIADILDEEYRKQGGVSEEDHPPAESTSSHLTCKRQNDSRVCNNVYVCSVTARVILSGRPFASPLCSVVLLARPLSSLLRTEGSGEVPIPISSLPPEFGGAYFTCIASCVYSFFVR